MILSKHHRSLILLVLALLQLVVILGSWLYSAAMPDSSVRAILSDGGIRWFFGTFVANLASPLLVYILLLDFAIGSCLYTGFWRGIVFFFRLRRNGLDLLPSFLLILLEIGVVMLLIFPHHAILLSATGSLFPSSFSTSLVAIIAFMILSSSITYGLFTGSLHNYDDVVNCCIRGGSNLKFILAVYVLGMELCKMLLYVLGI